MSEEEYKKFITPNEHERRVALVKKGAENARLKMERLNKLKRFNQWGRRVSKYQGEI